MKWANVKNNFISPNLAKVAIARADQQISLEEWWKRIVDNPVKQVYIVAGDAGVGKSCVLRWLARLMMEANANPEKFTVDSTILVPLYMPLLQLRDSKEKIDDAIARVIGCQKDYLQKIQRAPYRSIILLDAWDELHFRDGSRNILNEVNISDSIVIITCRTLLLRECMMSLSDSNAQVYYLQEFSSQQRFEYLRKRKNKPVEVQNFFQNLSIEQCEKAPIWPLLSNPLLLYMASNIGSDSGLFGLQEVTPYEIYKKYTEEKFSNEFSKLTGEGVWANFSYATSSNIKESIKRYAQRIAIQMHIKRLPALSVEEIDRIAQTSLADIPHPHSNLPMDPNLESNQMLFRRTCPLKLDANGKYTFLHSSLQEFLVAQALIEAVDLGFVTRKIRSGAPSVSMQELVRLAVSHIEEIENSPLLATWKMVSLCKQPEILLFFHELAKSFKRIMIIIEKQLLALMYLTRKHRPINTNTQPEGAVAFSNATNYLRPQGSPLPHFLLENLSNETRSWGRLGGNAMTIFSALSLNASGKDLSDIYLDGADLSGGSFHRTILQNAIIISGIANRVFWQPADIRGSYLDIIWDKPCKLGHILAAKRLLPVESKPASQLPHSLRFYQTGETAGAITVGGLFNNTLSFMPRYPMNVGKSAVHFNFLSKICLDSPFILRLFWFSVAAICFWLFGLTQLSLREQIIYLIEKYLSFVISYYKSSFQSPGVQGVSGLLFTLLLGPILPFMIFFIPNIYAFFAEAYRIVDIIIYDNIIIIHFSNNDIWVGQIQQNGLSTSLSKGAWLGDTNLCGMKLSIIALRKCSRPHGDSYQLFTFTEHKRIACTSIDSRRWKLLKFLDNNSEEISLEPITFAIAPPVHGSQDESLLVSYRDGTLKRYQQVQESDVWQVYEQWIPATPALLTAVAVLPDGLGWLAGDLKGDLSHWISGSAQPVRLYNNAHNSPIEAINAFIRSKSGIRQVLIVSACENRICIWNAITGGILREYTVKTKKIIRISYFEELDSVCLSFSSSVENSEPLFLRLDEGELCRLPLRADQKSTPRSLVPNLTSSSGKRKLYFLSFNPDFQHQLSRRIVTDITQLQERESLTSIWQVDEFLRRFVEMGQMISNAMAAAPPQYQLMRWEGAGFNPVFSPWEQDTSVICSVPNIIGRIGSMVCSSDGRWMAYMDDELNVHLLSLSHKGGNSTEVELEGLTGRQRCMALSSDGRHLAVSNAQGEIKIYNNKGKVIRVLYPNPHQSWISSLLWTDNVTLYIASMACDFNIADVRVEERDLIGRILGLLTYLSFGISMILNDQGILFIIFLILVWIWPKRNISYKVPDNILSGFPEISRWSLSDFRSEPEIIISRELAGSTVDKLFTGPSSTNSPIMVSGSDYSGRLNSSDVETKSGYLYWINSSRVPQKLMRLFPLSAVDFMQLPATNSMSIIVLGKNGMLEVYDGNTAQEITAYRQELSPHTDAVFHANHSITLSLNGMLVHYELQGMQWMLTWRQTDNSIIF